MLKTENMEFLKDEDLKIENDHQDHLPTYDSLNPKFLIPLSEKPTKNKLNEISSKNNFLKKQEKEIPITDLKNVNLIKKSKNKLHLKVNIPTNEIAESNEIGDYETPKKKKKDQTKIQKFVSKLYITKKFLRNLRNATVYRKPLWLKEFHFNLINDWSFDIENINNDKIDNFCSYFLKKFIILIKSFLDLIPIIHPTKIFHILFDTLLLVLTILCLIIIPIDMGFDIDFIHDVIVDDPHMQSGIKRLIF